MLKKIIIALAVLAAALVGVFLYINNRPLSPSGHAELTSGDLTVDVSYSRPSIRGRLIFGKKEDGALQPYGEYWRLGANRATEITFSCDVRFNNQPVKAGTYRMYAVPGRDAFKIVLNSELGVSGSVPPNHDLDVLETSVPVENPGTPVEQFTISMEPAEGGVRVAFEWADVRVVVMVEGC